ncbi:hypothetical protein M5D96_012860 [Drosophila gunungcola]|uniref:Uncharacterized protein n=1 Tax=Drosophila gunungcola TaxID=103775 RepID=A0A9Q0BJ42_9MUSC|nr:hypothetical protein M5D96_012860 [Drosophila gunungcola]
MVRRVVTVGPRNGNRNGTAARRASAAGVHHLVLIGRLARHTDLGRRRLLASVLQLQGGGGMGHMGRMGHMSGMDGGMRVGDHQIGGHFIVGSHLHTATILAIANVIAHHLGNAILDIVVNGGGTASSRAGWSSCPRRSTAASAATTAMRTPLLRRHGN